MTKAKAKAETKRTTNKQPKPAKPAPARHNPNASSKLPSVRLKQTKPAVHPPESNMIAPTKKDLVANLLRRPDGASLAELTAATGWQSHSVRAVMSGIRKDGGDITRSRGESGISMFSLGS